MSSIGSDLGAGLKTSVDSSASLQDSISTESDPMAGNDQVEGMVADATDGTAEEDGSTDATSEDGRNHVGDGKSSVLGANHQMNVSEGDFSTAFSSKDSSEFSQDLNSGTSSSGSATVNSFDGMPYGND